MPPLGGFWSKIIIILACIQANHPFLALISAVVSILTLAYYFRALTPALFGKEKGEPPETAAGPEWFMNFSMIVLAALSVISVFMIVPSGANSANILLRSAVSVLTDGKNYSAAVMGALR